MELDPAEVKSRIPNQKRNLEPGEMNVQPPKQEDGQQLPPLEDVVKQVVTEVAEENPKQEHIDEPLPSQDEPEQDSTDVIDYSSEQRHNSEVGESKAESPSPAATNQLVPSKTDIKQDHASTTDESSAHKPKPS